MPNGTQPLAGGQLPIANDRPDLWLVCVSSSIYRGILLFAKRLLTLIKMVFCSKITIKSIFFTQRFIPSVFILSVKS